MRYTDWIILDPCTTIDQTGWHIRNADNINAQ